MEITETVGTIAIDATIVSLLEFALFTTVFCAGFTLGIARALRDDRYRSFVHIISIGVCSGGLSFGLVAGICVSSVDRHHFFWPLVGLATLIGLFGKELEAPASALVFNIFEKALRKLGFLEDGKIHPPHPIGDDHSGTCDSPDCGPLAGEPRDGDQQG